MKQFFKDFFIYGVASVIAKIAAIFLMPIYTSILTREEYGAMAMLVSVKGIIDLFSNLNIHSGIARDYYEKGIDRQTLVSTGMWSILTLSCSIMVVMLLTRDFWLHTVIGLDGNDISFVLLLLSIPAGGMMSYFSILTRYKKKPGLFSIGQIISLMIQISTAIYTIVFARLGIVGFFIATLASEAFSIVFFGFINKEYISFKFKWAYLKRALKFAVPLLPAILAGWLDTSFGQLLTGKYVSLTELGIYSVALQLASVFTLIGTALHNVWSPFLYENYQKGNFQKEVERLYITFVLLLCIVSCSLSLLSREIILFLSNPNYLSATQYITLLCVPMSVFMLFPMASSGISISRDTKYTGIAYVSGSIFNLVFLFVFIKRLGVIAVPVGLTLSRIITYMIMVTVTKWKKFLILPNHYLLILIGLSLLNYLVVCQETSVFYRIILMVLIDATLSLYLFKRLDARKIFMRTKSKGL